MENTNVIIISNIILIKYLSGLIIVTLSLSLCYALHLNMEDILVILGQDREIARYSITIYLILIMSKTMLLNKQLNFLQLDVLQVSIVVLQWRTGTVAHWRSGAVAQWRSGAVAHWRTGAVAQWRSGAVPQWRSAAVAQLRSCAVAQWRSGAVAQWRSGAVPLWRSRTSSGPERRRLVVYVKRLAVHGEG